MRDKLNEMMARGEVTPYLYHRCLDQFAHDPPADMQEQMLKEASIMSGVGVESQDDHKHFMYVAMHLKPIVRDIASEPLSDDQLAKISASVFENRELYPIDTIFNFYKAADRAMRNLDLPIKKVAYPVGLDGGDHPDHPYDVAKWIQAMREIYARVHRGFSEEQALNKVTAGWDTMEKEDFKTWKRYYTEGTQHKYKTAQVSDYYQAEDGSPLLPLRDWRYRMPGGPDMNTVDLPVHIEDEKEKQRKEEESKEAERVAKIEDTRKKLISRLTSAERIATMSDADLGEALGMGLDEWLQMLHTLKRSIQTAPMRSAASPILYDLIIRKGNQLAHEGYVKTGRALLVLAQDAPKAPPVGDLPAPDPEAPPMEGMEEMAEMPEAPEDDAAMKDFMKLLNHEHLDGDEAESDDADDADDELVVEAQAIPPEAPAPAPEEELPMEELVEEPAIEVDEIADMPEQGDTLDTALEGITIEDVIERLELVSNIIQNREIPRQLSFADMQMGKLGIASFFPNLGEAIRSALESHQYIYTRVEDIISKLRGSVQPEHEIDLTSNEKSEEATSETLESVRRKLTESEEKEKQRAEARRAKREAREAAEVAPEAAPAPEAPPLAPEEIAGPVEVESAPPRRAT
jgi:hypothetical protein